MVKGWFLRTPVWGIGKSHSRDCERKAGRQRYITGIIGTGKGRNLDSAAPGSAPSQPRMLITRGNRFRVSSSINYPLPNPPRKGEGDSLEWSYAGVGFRLRRHPGR